MAAPAEPPTGVPEIRVGLLDGVPAVTLEAQGPAGAFRAGTSAFHLRPNEPVLIRGAAGGFQARGMSGSYNALVFTSLRGGRFLLVDGKPYRGAVEVIAGGGTVTVVNVLSLDDYLRGVVPAELGRRAPDEREALEAQAILSRTYALRNRGRFRASGYDVRAGVSDQVYGGVGAESPEGNAAVEATAGLVVSYGGELIVPFFHSTCGFSTASPQEAFRSVRATPYLRPVSDRNGDGFYCDISPRFRWSVEWDASQLRDILERTVPGVLGIPADEVRTLRDVYVRRTGRSGRALEVRLVTGGGEIPVFGPDVRPVLRTPDDRILGSQAVEIRTAHSGERLARVTASGAGWGHGVGMCQWGAIGRARAGQDAETILRTYFPGTTIARWY